MHSSAASQALRSGIRGVHIRYARRSAEAAKVRRPVHVLYYRVAQAGVIEIVRVLHEKDGPDLSPDRSGPRRESAAAVQHSFHARLCGLSSPLATFKSARMLCPTAISQSRIACGTVVCETASSNSMNRVGSCRSVAPWRRSTLRSKSAGDASSGPAMSRERSTREAPVPSELSTSVGARSESRCQRRFMETMPKVILHTI